MPKLVGLIYSSSLYFIKQALLPFFSCQYIPDLQSRWEGPTIIFPDGCPVPSSVSFSPLLQWVFLGLRLSDFTGPVASSSVTAFPLWPCSLSRQLPQPLVLLPLAPPSSLLEGMVQAFFLHSHCHRLLRKGGRGRNGLQLATNFLTVSYVNSFRLSGPQYYFRHSAWWQSCD